MELFRGLLGSPATDEDARFELLEGLFGGVAQEDVSRFEQELASRITLQRSELLRLREVVDVKFEAAKRKGVRNPESPSSLDSQNPAWSEYNLAKDAHKRAAALLKHQEKALKAIQSFARTTGGVPSSEQCFLSSHSVSAQGGRSAAARTCPCGRAARGGAVEPAGGDVLLPARAR